jgi:thiamine monophosphate synthase
MISDSFGFYAILTDPLRGYEYCMRMLVDHEITFVQLRMKDACDLAPSYVGVEPMFAAPTKKNPDPEKAVKRLLAVYRELRGAGRPG